MSLGIENFQDEKAEVRSASVARCKALRIGVSGYVGPARTGIARTLENLLSGLDVFSDSRFVVFRNEDMPELQIPQGKAWAIRKVAISCRSSLGNLLWHQFVYPFRLWREKADVSFIPNVTLLLWKVCPTVVMIHDMIEFHVPEKFSRLRMRYRHWAVPKTAKRADLIVTVSEHSRQDIIKICAVPPEKVVVAYNGVDERFRPSTRSEVEAVRSKYGIDGRYLLYVGTLDHPGKNAMASIKIFRALYQRGLVHRLVLVGRPSFGYEHLVSEIERLGISNEVLRLGHVKDADLMPLYSDAAAFSFLSFYEGFGLPALEAMACGAPTVVSNRSCLPEVVGDGALVADPEDISGAIEVFVKVLTDVNLQKELRQKGIDRARRFRWGTCQKIVLAAINQVARG